MNLHPLWLFLHVACVVVWVGGMFFAYVCLRPAAVEVLEPPLRLTLWKRVFERFFPWVWIAVGVILGTGFAMLTGLGMANAPLNLHLMFASGLVMVGIFVGVVSVPFAALKEAVAAGNWPAGGAALGRIRQLVGFNLLLGVATIALATLGRWL